MQLETLSRPFQKALTTNSAATSFASKIPTITEPANDGVINLVAGGNSVPQRMIVLPYGLGADNDVFDLRIIGWRHIGAGPTAAAVLWVPTILAGLTCTISAVVGIALAPVIETERFADTITLTANTAEPTITAATTRQGTVLIHSPTTDFAPAYAIVTLYGVEKVEFSFDPTTNTPTMNALIAFL